MRALLHEFKKRLSKLTYSQAALIEAPSPFVEMGLFCLSGGGGAWRSAEGLCAMRKRTKYGPVAALNGRVRLRPSHVASGVCTGVERCVSTSGAHELALDVVDSHVDGCGLVEVEAEMSELR